ncbi:RING/U-box superfamily protein [Rhynchospora pubera]|uniref:RING/U-box superfamily protein n=1 Tax=Rhynchospora pubera TaxID=906938 RepID=A0AAV8G2M9_9POAL|nr:RING/U-box superfamily protein [Rhynchospora pubera]
MSSLPPPVWAPPPPPTPLQTLSVPVQPFAAAVNVPPPSSLSLSPSLLIIAGIIFAVFIASVSIHLLLRLLSRRRSPSRVVSSYSFSSSTTGHLQFPTSPPEPDPTSDNNNNTKPDALIEALPLFTLASSLASLPRSSPDCAVWLSPFDPTAELRLLPACRHAFHAECIDTWLRSTPSCPLCRASVRLPFPPLPSASSDNQSGSFRVEIGTVSRRRNNEENPHATSGRSYSLGSFDYLVEDDIEAVVSRISRMKEEKEAETNVGAPPPPGEHVAEIAGEGRGWLRDYVDRIASSASSSFNSLRFSGRWSARWSHRPENGVAAGDSRRWDVEEVAPQTPVTGDEATFHAIYRWIVGV